MLQLKHKLYVIKSTVSMSSSFYHPKYKYEYEARHVFPTEDHFCKHLLQNTKRSCSHMQIRKPQLQMICA